MSCTALTANGHAVRGRPLGVLGGTPGAVRYAQTVRQWTRDLVYFTPPEILTGTERTQLHARAIGVVEGTIEQLVVDDGDHLRGVQMRDGCVIPRDALFVPPRFVPDNTHLVDLGCGSDADGWVAVDNTGRGNVPRSSLVDWIEIDGPIVRQLVAGSVSTNSRRGAARRRGHPLAFDADDRTGVIPTSRRRSIMNSVRTETRSGRNHGNGTAAAVQLPLRRLYVLRIGYLVLGVGLAVTKWPMFIQHEPWTLTQGVVNCMLMALSILWLVGIRYPLQMLPLLLFEVAWKLIWLAVVALPLWTAGQVDQATQDLTFAILWVAIPLAVIPWRYVLAQYVTKRGERWRAAPARPTDVRP
jgi:hypothetical protein